MSDDARKCPNCDGTGSLQLGERLYNVTGATKSSQVVFQTSVDCSRCDGSGGIGPDDEDYGDDEEEEDEGEEE